MTQLKSANLNPWYVLMTLYGEQEGTKVDAKLHEKNRVAWNAWAGQATSGEEREKAAMQSGATVAELSAWNILKAEIARQHETEFRRRNGTKLAYPGLPIAGDKIDLSKVAFSKIVALQDAVFFTSVTFGESTFHSSVTFGGSTFAAAAWFGEAQFEGPVWFGGVNFKANVVFLKSKFATLVSFAEATFGAEAGFGNAIFKGHTYFTSSLINDPNTRGISKVNFTDTHFEKPASFRNARFKTHYPVLAGTIFHDRTSFTVNAANWPYIRDHTAHDPPWGRTDTQDPEEAKESCNVIRHALSKQGMTEEVQFFFGREMRYAARTAGMQYPFYAAFWAFSNFGNAVWRPVVWLLALICAGTLAFWGLPPEVQAQCPDPVTLSASNVFNFFGYLRAYYPGCGTGLSDALKRISGGQTVLSYILLFFLGLGLRSRFRLR